MALHTHFEHVDLDSLPKSDPYWVGTSKKNDRNGHSPLSNALTLVVDDERLIADSLVAILRGKGFSAFAAYDGKQGLESARVLRPGVVITDILIPGKNGIEMSKGIREFLPGAAIFLVSGQFSTLTLLDNGPIPQDFILLAKPMHPDELLGAVQEHLRTKK